KLPVKMVLLDNQRLGMVRQWQELFFDARFSETILSDNPDFVRLASAFDIAGETITRKDEVPAAIARMLASEGAYLLHVSISAEENVWPLVPPGAANQDMMESKP
ncbi:MAG: thiamine pyrophosphate-dependent enzyme, partial [Tolumonas sp.]|nr:thiamine pyrophosphate-dependent enzyme [Tolumonas sp.]